MFPRNAADYSHPDRRVNRAHSAAKTAPAAAESGSDPFVKRAISTAPGLRDTTAKAVETAVSFDLSTRMSTPPALPDMQPETSTWSAVVPATSHCRHRRRHHRRRLVLPARARHPALSALPRTALRLLSRHPAGFADRGSGAPRRGTRPLKLMFAILALALVANAGLGAYHAGVEWGFWPGPAECTGPVIDLGSAANLLERLNSAKVVRCDEVQWRFLGLSLAGYNVLISLAMAALAAWGLARTRD